MEIFNLVFRYVFLGFVIWTFIWVFSANKHDTQQGTAKFDLLAVRMVMIFGVLHVLMVIFNFIEFNSEGIKINESLSERAFGKYWVGYWMYRFIYLFTYFGLPQLLWIRKIRTSKIIRIIMALWIFVIMHIEVLIILITSFHRDYVPES